jgi:hypothetical protein
MPPPPPMGFQGPPMYSMAPGMAPSGMMTPGMMAPMYQGAYPPMHQQHPGYPGMGGAHPGHYVLPALPQQLRPQVLLPGQIHQNH